MSMRNKPRAASSVTVKPACIPTGLLQGDLSVCCLEETDRFLARPCHFSCCDCICSPPWISYYCCQTLTRRDLSPLALQLLRDPQGSRAGARIRQRLGLGRLHGLPLHHSEDRFGFGSLGRERRAQAAAMTTSSAESPLSCPAFETLVGQDDDSAVMPGAMNGCVQCCVKRSELVVDGDSQRHERLRGCVKASRSRPGWDGCCDDGCKLGGSCDGMLLSRFGYCSCDASCPPFPSVLPEDLRDLILWQCVHQIGGGGLVAGVHPHVERPIGAETKATTSGR